VAPPPGPRATLARVTAAARVLSVNVGRPRPNPHKRLRETGIHKEPVETLDVRDPGPKRGGLGSGVVGDTIGDTRHHGGVTQAVYAYAAEDLRWWGEQLGRDLPAGLFGENLTTEGLDLTHALVGETWRLTSEGSDEVVLRVEAPRIPCATFAGVMQERGWVKRFTAEGRTGAYLSVVRPGTIGSGAAVEVSRPGHDVDLLTVFRGLTGDLDAARRVVGAKVLHPSEHADLERVVGARTD
jgi:MOSC domain-containing protein YiiM